MTVFMPFSGPMCLFQALLRHCFICLPKHIGTILQHEKVYSLEFVTTNSQRSWSMSFWEGKELVTMLIAHCGRDVSAVKSYFLLSSQVPIAVSTKHCIMCCEGSSLEFIKGLDNFPSQKADIQYPFSLSPLHVEKFMHKRSFTVMGKIDMFSKLRTLMIRLPELLDER